MARQVRRGAARKVVASPRKKRASKPATLDARRVREGLAALREQDEVLGRVFDAVGRFKLGAPVFDTNFRAVVRAIVFQQLSTASATAIFKRIDAAFGGTPTPSQLLSSSEEELRGLGLSRQKAAYLKDLAAHVEKGELDIENLHELEDAAVIDALTTVKGVGVWTAQMFLIFQLGRPDVLPDLDLGVRKGVQRVWKLEELPTPAEVRERGAAWKPFSTLATWYLWRSLDSVAGEL